MSLKQAKALTSTRENVFRRWLKPQQKAVGKHLLSLFTEHGGVRDNLIDKLREVVRSHYVAPEATAKRLAELGAPETAALLREHLPSTKKARSGDLGEILATEIVEYRLGYQVPVRRLRWKDGREMALRGDDIVAVKPAHKEKLQFLKGESKSRLSLTTTVINEAAGALDRDRGRPNRHSVIFVADRLREQGEDNLAKELEEAVLESFRAHRVEHFLFALTGNDAENLLSEHLKACQKKTRRRYAMCLRIKDHNKFIENLFSGF